MCFFFFQAEDGIRDDLVTGVQTCALPILAQALAARQGSSPRARRPSTIRSPSLAPRRGIPPPARPRRSGGRSVGPTRSEERRVGKRGDVGGRGDIKKKKKIEEKKCRIASK